MKQRIEQSAPFLFAIALFLCASFAHSQVSPFMGLGNAQFFDNNGNALTSGVLYSYQAGTSTQQATYTDYTGTSVNPNPIPFSSGARVNIWLTSSALYKFVLCLQNDGPVCAPADVLFSVDQVPGSPSNTSTSSAPFISNSPNPATTGILRLASTDLVCWRNAANTANLCISKDSSDVLSWGLGVVKFPESGGCLTSSGYDYLCGNSTQHRFEMTGNGGTPLILVGISTPATPGHYATFASNGIDIQDGGASNAYSITNDTVTGTTLNTLTKQTVNGSGQSTAVIASTSDVGGVIGICINSCGNTGTAAVATFGSASCVFDGATTANDYVIISSSISGNCHDSGLAPPNFPIGTQVIGRVQSSNITSGTYGVNITAESRVARAVQLHSRTTMSVSTNPPANTPTAVITKAVTMPTSGCPCRVLAQYSLNATFNVNGAVLDAWVSDGTNIMASSQMYGDGSSRTPGIVGMEMSPTTYANGAAATFNLYVSQSQANTVNAAPQQGSGTNSYLTLDVFPSN